MRYTGDYSDSASYNVGDVAIYTDGVPYHLQVPAVAGTGCYDTRHWGRVPAPLSEAFVALHDMLNDLKGAITETSGVVDSMLFDDKTIVLKSSTADSDKVYAITVDDEDGLEATEITEGEGGEE